jgi:hypothetical protein
VAVLRAPTFQVKVKLLGEAQAMGEICCGAIGNRPIGHARNGQRASMDMAGPEIDLIAAFTPPDLQYVVRCGFFGTTENRRARLTVAEVFPRFT